MIASFSLTGGGLSLGNAMSGIAGGINMWSFAMSEEDIAALSLIHPRGNIINADTLKTAGTVPEATLTVTKEVVKGDLLSIITHEH